MIWLIRREIDPEAEIHFLPADEVMGFAAEHDATPFHHPKAEIRHTGSRTGFDALVARHGLTDPALVVMSLILRGAETSERNLTQWSHGVRAVAIGTRLLHEDDAEYVAAMAPMLNALYRFSQDVASSALPPTAGTE
jgi:hypothetical protein